MRDFHDLKVWGQAHELVLGIYKASAGFPKSDLYALTSQARRAAISMASNIAEGCGRKTETDFARFLQMAMGSASEVQYDLLLARDLGYIDPRVYQQLEKDVTEVKRMLTALIQKLNADS